MVDLYPNYDETTASRIVRFHPDWLYAELAIFDPPASFAGTPRPWYLFESGGARQARRDFRIGSSETSPGVHSVPGMITEELGGYVVVISTPPGGLDFEAAEEPGQQYAPECRLAAALGPMFLRGNATNPAVCGPTHTFSTLRRHSAAAGTSAGVWSQLGAQMLPAGEFGDLAAAIAARGDGRYRYDPDHTVGHFYGAIGQNALDFFGEYVAVAGDTTYVAGATAAGASAIAVSGDSVELRRHNRLTITTTTSYTVNGAQNTGTNALAVTGSSTPIPTGAFVRLVATDLQTYEFIVGADFAGGTGTIDARDWGPAGSVTIASGTALEVRVEYAVRVDYAGGSGSVQVWPTVQFPIAAASAVVLQHFNAESYGEHSWAVGYCGTASMGRVWRSDHSSGRGVPSAEKYDASVDRFAVASNPRAFDLNLLLSGGYGGGLQRVDIVTGERSFWTRRNVARPAAALPEDIDLHDTGDMASLAHQLYLLRLARSLNTAGVHAYLGNRRDNPLGTAAAVPWLKGRGASFDAQVLKTFLTDPARYGGPFA